MAPQQRKAKQRKILIFNENRDFLFSPNDNDFIHPAEIVHYYLHTPNENLHEISSQIISK